MKLAIMQPYFLPYIGYFQLIASVDVFVLYDNVKYTKKGWINRNRILLNGRDHLFSLPLQHGSDALLIRQRELSPSYNRAKLLRLFREAYHHAPCFNPTISMLEEIVCCSNANLFDYIHSSLLKLIRYLSLPTKVLVSSTINIDHGMKCQNKVIAICKALEATTYLNPQGGRHLYSEADFQANGVELKFLTPSQFIYHQFNDNFVDNLSIIDVLMFNPGDQVRHHLSSFDQLY